MVGRAGHEPAERRISRAPRIVWATHVSQLLGRTASVGYNPDSFGHPGTLPQILALQGIRDYVFMRPEPKEKNLPGNLFWWEGPDKTRVLTYRIPFSYNDDRAVERRLQRIITELKPAEHTLMAFYGAGDHGGGATKENIRSIDELRKSQGGPEVLYSTPERYFATVREQGAAQLPLVTGDLQHHSVGCYTAESDIKKANRTTEIALTSAEKLSAIGSVAWGANYPKDEFTAAWRRVLLLQFHDSLAGTSLPEHYKYAAPQGYGFAREIADRALVMAGQKLAWQVPTQDPESEYLVAFNLHPWPVTANLEYDLRWKPGTVSTVEDENGHAIGHQWIPATSEVNDRQRLVLRTALPAFGYRQIRIRKVAAEPGDSVVHVSDRTLENEFLRATFGEDGGVEILDKRTGRPVLVNGGGRALVMDDPSDTWSHNVRAYDKQIGAFGNAQITALENGPVRASMRVRTTYGDSSLNTVWILYAGSPALEARVAVDWHEHRKILKLSFPVDIKNPRPTYEIAYGNIVREPNGDEEPGQRWLDVSGDSAAGQYGLAVINDAKYGYSVDGADLRISAVRGAPYAHHMPHVLDAARDHLWQDQGVQTFRMLLVPHRGSWQDAGVQRIAEEFTTPAPIIYQGIHPGSRPQSDSFVSVDAPDVDITAIKRAESGDDLILRCYETAGRTAKANIDLRFGAGLRWSGQFRPYEIKTLRIGANGPIREVNLLEE